MITHWKPRENTLSAYYGYVIVMRSLGNVNICQEDCILYVVLFVNVFDILFCYWLLQTRSGHPSY